VYVIVSLAKLIMITNAHFRCTTDCYNICAATCLNEKSIFIFTTVEDTMRGTFILRDIVCSVDVNVSTVNIDARISLQLLSFFLFRVSSETSLFCVHTRSDTASFCHCLLQFMSTALCSFLSSINDLIRLSLGLCLNNSTNSGIAK